VRSDPAAVLAFVRKNGLCLKDASETLRQNEEIVRTACRNHPLAVLYCEPGPTYRRLGGDKSFMLDIFDRLTSREPRIWEMLAPYLKHNSDIVVAAQASQSLVLSDAPHALTSDPAFWMDVIMRDSSLWFALPEGYKVDPSFALSIKTFASQELVSAVFDRFPCLRSDRDVWTTIIDSTKGDDFLPDLIGGHAPDQIRLDKVLMLCACKKNAAVLQLLSTPLQQDREIIEAVVKGSIEALVYIPFDSQRLYPDLIVKAISNMSTRGGGDFDHTEYIDQIAVDLWTNVDVTRAWLKGFPLNLDQFPQMRHSKEFGLLVAEHRPQDFDELSEALRSDKEFMMQAVEINCLTLLGAAGGLDRDFDLAEAAFGATYHAQCVVGDFLLCCSVDTVVFLRAHLRQAQHELSVHDGFVKGLLCGMSVDAGAECHLPMLERGAETSLAWKKLIAKYVGVPTGSKLRVLRRVAENLALLGFCDSDGELGNLFE
jgi:Domain of unknown function (DUF4116)